MKKLTNAIKTIILTGAIAIITYIPTFASEKPTNQVQDKNIIGVYTESNDNFYVEKGDCITEYADGSYYINSDVNIYSIDKLDNTITVINNSNELYTFYADNIDSYYLNEQINITIDQNNSIIDCIVDSQPIAYNTQISQIEGDTAFIIANGNKYSFENIEDSDGWKTEEKCKVIIQNGKLLEVRPIPLSER